MLYISIVPMSLQRPAAAQSFGFGFHITFFAPPRESGGGKAKARKERGRTECAGRHRRCKRLTALTTAESEAAEMLLCMATPYIGGRPAIWSET